MNLRTIGGVCSGVLSLSLITGTAFGQEEEAAAAAQSPWTGKVSFGYLATTGNSEATSVNGATEISYEKGKWKHTLDASALGSQDDVDTTAEAYQLGWKTDYSLGEFDYIFVDLRWLKDKFSGYEQQTSESIGYGRRIINTDKHVLNLEIGAGAKQAELRNGISQDETILLGTADYDWQFSETASFSQELRVEAGDENTFLESVTALNAKIFKDLGLVISYTVRNNSDVPVDTEKTDTFTAISLEYLF
ncbi:MAG: DUF481 domain-containing protein [Pseudomonadota bacterium]